MNRSIVLLDTLDDRREIHALLHRLPPQGRVAFLRWCCDQVRNRKANPNPDMRRMRDRIAHAQRGNEAHDDALTNETYWDVLALGAQYGLDLRRAAVELESRVRALR